MLINTLFTITFAVELLAELRTWLTCSIRLLARKVLMDDDLAALTARLPPRCIGSHFHVRVP